MVLLLGTVVSAIPTASGAVLADNTPFLDALDGGNPRDDHSFVAAAGSWSVAGTLLYEQAGNSGDFRAELRRGSTAGAVMAYDFVGNFYTRAPLSLLAFDGTALGAPDTFYVSEVLTNVAPSYAVEFEGAPVAVTGSPFQVSSSVGPTGVLESYSVLLNRRDTVDVRLTVPDTYTYNYNLQLYLFGGAATDYYSATGAGSAGPAAVSGGPMNSEQFLRFTAPVTATYLLVVGNTKELSDVPFNLTVHTNGAPLSDVTPQTGQVDSFNRVDDFAFANALDDWAFAAVRTDDPGYGRWLTAEFHTPTFDSNVLASEAPTTGALRVGVLAVNRYDPDTAAQSLVSVRWGPNGIYPVPYTVELDNRVPVLASGVAPTRFDFAEGEVLRGASVQLLRGETVELHARPDAFYTYPYELQLIVFAPGESYYAASGPAQAGPIAAAREGANSPKDLVFTAPADGTYGVALLSLASTYAVPVDLYVRVQGVPLPADGVAVGTLSDSDAQDLLSVRVDPGRWGIVAGRYLGGGGAFQQRVHASGFDTNPVAWDTLGSGPGQAAFAIEAVNAYTALGGDYYVSVLRTSGTASYLLEFDSAPQPVPRDGSRNVSVPDGQLVSGYEINLVAGETVDFRLQAEAGWSYAYRLQLLVFSPLFPYHSLSGGSAPGPLAASPGAADAEQDVVVVAPVTGSYLVVVANLGNLTATPATLSAQINGTLMAAGQPGAGDLTNGNSADYFEFGAAASSWTVAGVKVMSTSDPTATLLHRLLGPTADSLPLAVDRVRALGGEGLIAVDGFALPANTTYFLSEGAALGPGHALTYAVQVTSLFQALAPQSQVVTGTLPSAAQFVGYTLFLSTGQTLDLRLRRAEGFSYPFNLGLFVFAPGSGNASSSGEAGGAPVSASANGPSAEQDGIFTAAASGTYLVLIANLDVPREVNYSLNLTLDGWELLEDTHLGGDLNAFNRADQYRFQAAAGAWSVAGVKWTDGPGTVRAGLHTLGLNTVPLSTVDAALGGPVAVLPFFAPANTSNNPSTFFLNVTMAPQPGAPSGEYSVDFTGQAPLWGNAFIGNTSSFTLDGRGFVSLHALDLRQGDWLEIRLIVSSNYTKMYDLDLALFAAPLAPEILQAAPAATARAGANVGETLTFFADTSAVYLLVVENVGSLDTIPYFLSITRHTVIGSPPRPVNVTVTHTDTAFIEVAWSPSDEADFLAYEVWVSTDPAQLGVMWDRITVRDQTSDRIEGPGIEPDRVYTVRVLVFDTENLNAWSNPVTARTAAKSIWQDATFLTLLASAIAVGVLVTFVYFRVLRQRSGKPFRLRSSRAEGVVEERKGPAGKPRAPKEAEAAAAGAPPPPSKQSQDAVDFMQRMMKGGR